MRRKNCRCTSGYLHRPSFQYAASAASAASSPSPPFPILHHSSANVCTPWALAFQLRLAPGQRVPILAHRHFQSISRKTISLLYYRTATGLLSNSAFSVVPVANVLACRRSLPPATPRPGLAFFLTSLSRVTLVSRQHTVVLHIASPNHPAACGTWSRLVVSRATISFPTFYSLLVPVRALLALAVAPTNNTPSVLFYCRP
jgi:hypothetical protein